MLEHQSSTIGAARIHFPEAWAVGLDLQQRLYRRL